MLLQLGKVVYNIGSRYFLNNPVPECFIEMVLPDRILLADGGIGAVTASLLTILSEHITHGFPDRFRLLRRQQRSKLRQLDCLLTCANRILLCAKDVPIQVSRPTLIDCLSTYTDAEPVSPESIFQLTHTRIVFASRHFSQSFQSFILT